MKLELVGTKLELDEKKLELEEGKRAYKTKVNEVEQLKKEKVDKEKAFRNDMMTVINSLNRGEHLKFEYRNADFWCFVPDEIRIKYDPDYNYRLSYVSPSRR